LEKHLFKVWHNKFMSTKKKKIKIKVKKKKKRVPLPKKPPKVIEDKKAYNRKKEKDKARKKGKE